MRALQVSPSRGMKISQTVQGTFCEPIDDGGGSNSRARQFLLTDWRGDYFICRTLSVGVDNALTIGASDVYIAKPPEIRLSAFDGLTRAVVVEVWDGLVLTEVTVNWSYDYLTPTFRIATNTGDSSTQAQNIIPRFVKAVVVTIPADETHFTTIATDTIAPTIINAVECGGMGMQTDVHDPEADPADGNPATQRSINLLALSDGWAWAKTS